VAVVFGNTVNTAMFFQEMHLKNLQKSLVELLPKYGGK
jgi:hypothetical protein